MAIETKFPLTRQELADISTGLVRFPASFEEYWGLLESSFTLQDKTITLQEIYSHLKQETT